MRLRGAIIGYGFISAHGHLPAYLQRSKTIGDVEIVALADICNSRLKLARQNLPISKFYSSALELLDAEFKNLDFVDISTPPCDHAKIAHWALDRGLHVLCEKPLTATLDEAKSLLEHAKAAERVVFPCHNYKHAPVVQAARRIIQSGRIGRVKSVTLNTFRNRHAYGVPEWKPHWRRIKEISGGGITMDHGPHTFYLTFDWLGSYPQSISAKVQHMDQNPEWRQTEDNLSASLTFPTGFAHVYLSWTAGVRKALYTIQGEGGAVIIDNDELRVEIMRSVPKIGHLAGEMIWDSEKQNIASQWMDASHVNWFNSLFEQFQKAMSDRDFVSTETWESYLCVELINCAYRSAQESSREISLQGRSERAS